MGTIVVYVTQAENAIKKAIPDLQAYRDGKANNDVKKNVNRWFSGANNLNNDQIKAVIAVYQKVFDGVNAFVTSFVNEPKRAVFGEVQALTNMPNMKRIVLGSDYHKAKEREQFWTIIHEFMHYFAGLPGNSAAFKEKYFRPETAFDETKAIQFWDIDDVTIDRKMNIADRIQCADVYAGFIVAYYWKK